MGYHLPRHVRVAEVLHVGHRYVTAIRNREHPPVTSQSTDSCSAEEEPNRRRDSWQPIPEGWGRNKHLETPRDAYFGGFFFFSSSEVSKDRGSLVLQKANGIRIHNTLGAVYDRSSRIRWQLRSALATQPQLHPIEAHQIHGSWARSLFCLFAVPVLSRRIHLPGEAREEEERRECNRGIGVAGTHLNGMWRRERWVSLERVNVVVSPWQILFGRFHSSGAYPTRIWQ